MLKRIAITGASGVLGMALAVEARDRGHEVVALYRSTPIAIPGTQCRRLDLVDEREALATLDQIAPECVLNAAAEVRVDWCEENAAEAARINVDTSAMLAKFAARTGTGFLHVSTDSVFDGSKQNYTETDTPAPVNVYSTTKLRAEEAVLAACPNAIIARTNFYGWTGYHKTGLVDWILQQLEAHREFPGFVDAIFCPLLVNDSAATLLDLVAHEGSGVFHVVGSEAISKYDFAVRVAETFGYDSQLVRQSQVSDARMKAARPANTSLDTSRVAGMLGRVMPDVAAGLRRFAELRASGYQQTLNSYYLQG